MYILSLVHQREERARESDDSLIQAMVTPTVPGNCSWDEGNDCRCSQKSPKWMMMKNPVWAEEANNRPLNTLEHAGTQLDMWRNPKNVMADHCQYTHLGRFFAGFCHFPAPVVPHWSPEEPNLPVKVSLNFKEQHGEPYRSGKEAPNIEIWPRREISPFWACQLRDFWDDARIPHSRLRATFEVWEEPSAHAWYASLKRS